MVNLPQRHLKYFDLDYTDTLIKLPSNTIFQIKYTFVISISMLFLVKMFVLLQGTLPSNQRHTSYKPMCAGVTISYIVIAMCQFPLAIVGFWAYGNKASKFSFIELNGILMSWDMHHIIHDVCIKQVYVWEYGLKLHDYTILI